jgi:hypothetical protein
MTELWREDDHNRHVPTAPLLGALALVFAWVIERGALAGRLATGGKWPLTYKFWVVTAITVLATIYKLTYRQKHKAYDQSSPIATNFQS